MIKSKKTTSFIAALALVLSMIISTASPVLAAEIPVQTQDVIAAEASSSNSISTCSDYVSSGWFETTYAAPQRSYDGDNIAITISAHNSMPNHINKTFTVVLYRKNFIGSTMIGSVEFARDCTNKTEYFPHVGAGKYYFVFKKAGDSTKEYLDYVHYFNY